MTWRLRETSQNSGSSIIAGTYTYYGSPTPYSVPTGFTGSRYRKLTWDMHPTTLRRVKSVNSQSLNRPHRPWLTKSQLIPPGFDPNAYHMRPLNPFEVRTFSAWANISTVHKGTNVYPYTTAWDLTGPFGELLLSMDPKLFLTQDGINLDLAASPIMDSKLVDILKWKAYRKVGASTAELGIAFGQIGQTVVMLAKPLKVALRVWRFLQAECRAGSVLMNRAIPYFMQSRHRVPAKRRTKQLMKKAADNWLEFSYGLLPTIQDVKDGVEGIEQILKPFRRVKLAKAGKKTTTKVVSLITVPIPTTNFSLKYRKTEETTFQYTCKYFYKFNMPETPGQILGLDVNSIATVAWDLLPWSFVVDWFLDVGGFLNSITRGRSATVLGDFTSLKVTKTIWYECIEASYWGSPISTPSSFLKVRYESLKRVTNQSPAAFPGLCVPTASFMRSMNAFSLMIQKFIRHW